MCVNTNGCVYKGINGTGQGGCDKARDKMKRLKGSSEAGIRVVNTVIQPITSVGIFSKTQKVVSSYILLKMILTQVIVERKWRNIKKMYQYNGTMLHRS